MVFARCPSFSLCLPTHPQILHIRFTSYTTSKVVRCDINGPANVTNCVQFPNSPGGVRGMAIDGPHGYVYFTAGSSKSTAIRVGWGGEGWVGVREGNKEEEECVDIVQGSIDRSLAPPLASRPLANMHHVIY